MADFGRILIFIGSSLVIAGIVIVLAVRYFPIIGNLPGDFSYEGDGFKFYFPFATMLILSILGSILLNIIMRIFK